MVLKIKIAHCQVASGSFSAIEMVTILLVCSEKNHVEAMKTAPDTKHAAWIHHLF